MSNKLNNDTINYYSVLYKLENLYNQISYNDNFAKVEQFVKEVKSFIFDYSEIRSFYIEEVLKAGELIKDNTTAHQFYSDFQQTYIDSSVGIKEAPLYAIPILFYYPIKILEDRTWTNLSHIPVGIIEMYRLTQWGRVDDIDFWKKYKNLSSIDFLCLANYENEYSGVCRNEISAYLSIGASNFNILWLKSFAIGALHKLIRHVKDNLIPRYYNLLPTKKEEETELSLSSLRKTLTFRNKKYFLNQQDLKLSAQELYIVQQINRGEIISPDNNNKVTVSRINKKSRITNSIELITLKAQPKPSRYILNPQIRQYQLD